MFEKCPSYQRKVRWAQKGKVTGEKSAESRKFVQYRFSLVAPIGRLVNIHGGGGSVALWCPFEVKVEVRELEGL